MIASLLGLSLFVEIRVEFAGICFGTGLRMSLRRMNACEHPATMVSEIAAGISRIYGTPHSTSQSQTKHIHNGKNSPSEKEGW